MVHIRRIVGLLMGDGGSVHSHLGGASLARSIGGGMTAAWVATAIQEFRERCTKELGCGMNDVIETRRGGGYRIVDRIDANHGREHHADAETNNDSALVMRQLKRLGKRTARQLADAAGITLPQTRAALSALVDEHAVKQSGSGSGVIYELQCH